MAAPATRRAACALVLVAATICPPAAGRLHRPNGTRSMPGGGRRALPLLNHTALSPLDCGDVPEFGTSRRRVAVLLVGSMPLLASTIQPLLDNVFAPLDAACVIADVYVATWGKNLRPDKSASRSQRVAAKRHVDLMVELLSPQAYALLSITESAVLLSPAGLDGPEERLELDLKYSHLRAALQQRALERVHAMWWARWRSVGVSGALLLRFDVPPVVLLDVPLLLSARGGELFDASGATGSACGPLLGAVWPMHKMLRALGRVDLRSAWPDVGEPAPTPAPARRGAGARGGRGGAPASAPSTKLGRLAADLGLSLTPVPALVERSHPGPPDPRASLWRAVERERARRADAPRAAPRALSCARAFGYGTRRRRIALVFFGLNRSLRRTLESIQAQVLAPLAAYCYTWEVFVHTYSEAVTFNSRANELGVRLGGAAEMRALLRPAKMAVTAQADADAAWPLELVTGRHGSYYAANATTRNLLRQLHSLQLATRLWERSSARFALVAYLRPDLEYLRPLDVPAAASVRPGELFVPYWAAWKGANDRVAFGAPDAMAQWGRRVELAREYARHAPLSSEGFLAFVLERRRLVARSTSLLGMRVRAGNASSPDLGLGVQCRWAANRCLIFCHRHTQVTPRNVLEREMRGHCLWPGERYWQPGAHGGGGRGAARLATSIASPRYPDAVLASAAAVQRLEAVTVLAARAGGLAAAPDATEPAPPEDESLGLSGGGGGGGGGLGGDGGGGAGAAGGGVSLEGGTAAAAQLAEAGGLGEGAGASAEPVLPEELRARWLETIREYELGAGPPLPRSHCIVGRGPAMARSSAVWRAREQQGRARSADGSAEAEGALEHGRALRAPKQPLPPSSLGATAQPGGAAGTPPPTSTAPGAAFGPDADVPPPARTKSAAKLAQLEVEQLEARLEAKGIARLPFRLPLNVTERLAAMAAARRLRKLCASVEKRRVRVAEVPGVRLPRALSRALGRAGARWGADDLSKAEPYAGAARIALQALPPCSARRVPPATWAAAEAALVAAAPPPPSPSTALAAALLLANSTDGAGGGGSARSSRDKPPPPPRLSPYLNSSARVCAVSEPLERAWREYARVRGLCAPAAAHPPGDTGVRASCRRALHRALRHPPAPRCSLSEFARWVRGSILLAEREPYHADCAWVPQVEYLSRGCGRPLRRGHDAELGSWKGCDAVIKVESLAARMAASLGELVGCTAASAADADAAGGAADAADVAPADAQADALVALSACERSFSRAVHAATRREDVDAARDAAAVVADFFRRDYEVLRYSFPSAKHFKTAGAKPRRQKPHHAHGAGGRGGHEEAV